MYVIYVIWGGPQAAATHALHSNFVPTLCAHHRPSSRPPTLALDE